LQALYQMEVSDRPSSGAARDLWRHFGEPEEAQRFAAELVEGVLERRERIDALIAASSEHWRLSRLPQVDRNILRVATYELLCRPDVPASVAIDEAIEIAKRFGSDESPQFVNGVLDHVATTLGATQQGGAA
jgi:N utilization substance protein B